MSCLFPAELISSYALFDPGDSGSGQGPDGARRGMEKVIDRGNWLFGAISVIDLNWHTEVYEGKTHYDPAEEAVIVGYYRAWLQPTDDLLTKIGELESQGYPVDGAEEFRANCREARGSLTDDAEFFAGDDLAEMRDRTIDAHREGRTADFNVLGE